MATRCAMLPVTTAVETNLYSTFVIHYSELNLVSYMQIAMQF